MRRLPQQERSRARVDRILACAESIITERGYDGLSLSEVAEKASVNIASIYQYFPNRRALLRRLAEGYNDEIRASLDRKLTSAPLVDGVEAVDHIIETIFLFYKTNPAYLRIWSGMQSDAGLQALDMADMLANADLLSRHLNPLVRLPAPELTALSRLLCSMVTSALRQALALPAGEATLLMKEVQFAVRAALAAKTPP